MYNFSKCNNVETFFVSKDQPIFFNQMQKYFYPPIDIKVLLYTIDRTFTLKATMCSGAEEQIKRGTYNGGLEEMPDLW